MTGLTYRHGDATEPPERPVIVAHVVNDIGLFGAGFAAAVAVRWPAARTDYRGWQAGPEFRLGAIRLTTVDDDVWVAHLAAQHGVGRRSRPLHYDKLTECLNQLAIEAKALGATVVMPMIGTGLAGGSWERVGPIAARLAESVPVVVYRR